MKSKDLITRLREIEMFSFGQTANQAADRIEELLAENAELKKELRQLDRDTMEHRHAR